MTPRDDFPTQGGVEPINLAAAAPFRLGALEIRPSRRQVRAGAREVIAEPRVLQVLIALAEAHGAVVSREELVRRCWEGRIIGEDAINRSIAKARGVAELTDPPAFAIETIPRVGYRLIAEAADPDATADNRPPNPISAGAIGSGARTGMRLNRRAAVLAVAAGMILAVLAAVAVSLLPARPPYLIAVRTFAVSGGAADLGQSLADRIAEEVNGRQLPVVSRDRSSRGDLDGAHYVVGGDIRRIGDLVRVDVRLDDAKSNLNLWTDTFTRSAAEADALQDQVADKVADVLDLTRRWLGSRSEGVKPEAVAALIKATDVMRGGHATLLETREGFQRFRDLAPNISIAHSSFAMATAMAADAEPADTATEWRLEARHEAERALALDPNNSEAYKVLGYLASDLVQRQAWYAKGLAVNPNDPNLPNFNGNLLLDVGRTQEGVMWLDRAVKLDPLSSPKTQSLMTALSIAGRYDEAAAMFPRAQRLWPDDIQLQNVILMTSLIYASPAQASAALDRVQASSHPVSADHAAAWRQYEKARAGSADKAEAARRLAALAATARGQEVDSLIAALASLGDRDDAFRIIGLSNTTAWSTSILFQPATASLRADPRFAAVAEQSGLTRYWAKSGKRPDVCAAVGTGSFPGTWCSPHDSGGARE
jgi:DNA-binding winged helix-turn-helix (wHTH) protein/tetratricopeptide (TPR) repeat protein